MKKILSVIAVVIVFASGCKKEPIDKCINIPCQNGGSCNQTTGVCNCPAGWKGLDCSIPIPACESNHFGTVRVNSSHSDAYWIYINGSYRGTQYYGTVEYSNVPSGYTTISQRQVDYYIYQNTYSQAGNVSDCGILNTTF